MRASLPEHQHPGDTVSGVVTSKERHAVSECVREPRRCCAAAIGTEPHLRVRQDERRALGRDRDISGRHQADACTGRGALHDHDDRGVQRAQRQQRAVQLGRERVHGGPLIALLGHPAKVAADAEDRTPRAQEHDADARRAGELVATARSAGRVARSSAYSRAWGG
jgi:hypothetical protein